MNERDERAKEALITYFSHNGLLLCNENAELPYLDLVGGSWNAIVALMESGDVFYSRFFRQRVTYLSRGMYAALKPHRRRNERLGDDSLRLLTFLTAAGEANATQMQNACLFDKKTQTKALDQLVSELFVTVIRRDETIHESWCTFYYGPAERWEEKRPANGFSTGPAEAERLLGSLVTGDQVQKLLK